MKELEFACMYVDNLLYFTENGILKCLPFITWKSGIIVLIRLVYRITVREDQKVIGKQELSL